MTHHPRFTLAIASAVAAVALITSTGCAVTRGQESVGAYVDDTAITTAIKARFIENKDVDASAISVETLKGTVQLSGFAKTMSERNNAEVLARKINGVRMVKNDIVVRP